MTDLQTRFKTLDTVSAPDLWYSIEERAMAIQPTRRRTPWLLVAVMLLLVLAIGGAILVGSGIVKLPVTVDASASPSASVNPSAQESSSASSSPAANRAPGWTATGPMMSARLRGTATLLKDGRVLVTGGVDPKIGGKEAHEASAELYDPATGSWSLTGAMLEGRYGHTATLLPDGTVLVTGGSGNNPGLLASAELYDPTTGTWTATGPMLEPRIGHTATLLPDGTVLVAGSFSGSSEGTSSLASAELFDAVTGSWSATASMSQARGTHLATLLQDGTVLVTAGTAATPSGELYDPVAKTWSDTGPMVEGGTGQTATLLPDGTVLVTGQSAQLYNPTDQSWTPTGPMVTVDPVGYRHTATLLPDGTVLVVGGYDTNGDGVAAAELYDPSTGTWATTIRMIERRDDSHTATLLQDGTVLVAGGATTIYADSLDDLLRSAELYDPGSGL